MRAKKNNSKASPKKSERGQSLVELAISLPVILLLMIGAVDFGLAIYAYLSIRDAAQEGALYASINPGNTAEIENRTRAINPQEGTGIYFQPVKLNDEERVKITVTVTGKKCEGITNGAVNSVSVNVKYRYPLIVPFANLLMGAKTIPLEASATNVIIQPAC
ncbi:MAG: pilus assembly protein [Anaerolineales bacterium]|nr:pilus assembly protein [Anaerolineales bacterium]